MRRNAVMMCGLLLMCAAFGARHGRAEESEKTSPTHIILIFDKSYSMSRDTDGNDLPGAEANPNSRFAIAWKFIENLVEVYSDPKLSGSGEFTFDMFRFDSVVHPLLTIDGRRNALERLRALKSEFKPSGETDIIKAIGNVAGHIRTKVKEKSDLLVVLVTDGEQTVEVTKLVNGVRKVIPIEDAVEQAVNDFKQATGLVEKERGVIASIKQISWGALDRNRVVLVPRNQVTEPDPHKIGMLSKLSLDLDLPTMSGGKITVTGKVGYIKSENVDEAVLRVSIPELNGKIAKQEIPLDLRGNNGGFAKFEFTGIVPEDLHGDQGHVLAEPLPQKLKPAPGVSKSAVFDTTFKPVEKAFKIGAAPVVGFEYPKGGKFPPIFTDMLVNVKEKDFIIVNWNQTGYHEEISWVAATGGTPPKVQVTLTGPDGKPLPQQFRPDRLFPGNPSSGTIGIEVTGLTKLKSATMDLVHFTSGSGNVRFENAGVLSAALETHPPRLLIHGYDGAVYLDGPEGAPNMATIPLASIRPEGDARGYKMRIKLVNADPGVTLRINEVVITGGEWTFNDSSPAEVDAVVPMRAGEQTLRLYCWPADATNPQLTPMAAGGISATGVIEKKIVFQVIPPAIVSDYKALPGPLFPDEPVKSGEFSVWQDSQFNVGEKETELIIKAPPYSTVWLESGGKPVNGPEVFNRDSAGTAQSAAYKFKVSSARAKTVFAVMQKTSIPGLGSSGSASRASVWLVSDAKASAAAPTQMKAESVSFSLLLKKDLAAKNPLVLFFNLGRPDMKRVVCDGSQNELTEDTPIGTKVPADRVVTDASYLKAREEFIKFSAPHVNLELLCDTEGIEPSFVATGAKTATLEQVLKNCGIRFDCRSGAQSGQSAVAYRIRSKDDNVAFKVKRDVRADVTYPPPVSPLTIMGGVAAGILALGGGLALKRYMDARKELQEQAAPQPAAMVEGIAPEVAATTGGGAAGGTPASAAAAEPAAPDAAPEAAVAEDPPIPDLNI